MKRIFQPQILPALVCMATLQKGPREVFSLISSPNFRFSKKSVKIANQTNVTDRENASVVPTFRLKKEGNHFLVHPFNIFLPPQDLFVSFHCFWMGLDSSSFFHFLWRKRFTRELHQVPSSSPSGIFFSLTFFFFFQILHPLHFETRNGIACIYVEIRWSVWFLESEYMKNLGEPHLKWKMYKTKLFNLFFSSWNCSWVWMLFTDKVLNFGGLPLFTGVFLLDLVYVTEMNLGLNKFHSYKIFLFA